jgi:hypothetical protein
VASRILEGDCIEQMRQMDDMGWELPTPDTMPDEKELEEILAEQKRKGVVPDVVDD